MITRNRRQEALQEIHDCMAEGYLGVSKTVGKLKELFCWVNLQTQAKEWCKKCATQASD